jgi:L-threonylcarbamoyladenylate synthase
LPSASDLEAAARIIRDGGVVCIPTESRYGLAADPRCGAALEKIASLKGRREGVPFALIAADAAQAQMLFESWPEVVQKLAEAHWPGALTIVWRAAAGLNPLLVGPSGGVGVRVSSNQVAGDLARQVGSAISATSANPTGREPARSVEEARAYFGDALDAYVDGGLCDGQVSTVVEVLDDGALRMLRPGPVVLALGADSQ